jgi:hypothetical protein
VPPRRESPEESIRRMTAAGAVTSVGVNAAALAGGETLRAALGPGARTPERAFQQDVIDLAHSCGWLVAHFRAVCVQKKGGGTFYETPVAADGKGWPDLVLARERLVAVELKAGRNTLEPDQEKWRDALRRAGVEWHCFYPKDWPEIERVLA